MHHSLQTHINPIMGCMTQLFCTRCHTINKSNKDDLHRLMLALEDHIHKRCHMEMVWCAIVRFRQHCLVESKPRPNKTNHTEDKTEAEAVEDHKTEAEAVEAEDETKSRAETVETEETEEDETVETEEDTED